MTLLTAAEATADALAAAQALRDNTKGSSPDIFGLPQGYWSESLIGALRSAGMKIIAGIGTYNGGARIPVGEAGGGGITNGVGLPAIMVPGYVDFTSRVQVDGAPTGANLVSYIDALIRMGASGGCYTHGIDAATAVKFDTMCAHLKLRQGQGLIDVITMAEWTAGLSGARIQENTGRVAA